MINKLIDINVSIPKQTRQYFPSKGEYSIQEYVLAFIYGMSETQRERFKKMLENNIECGMSVAESYGVDYNDFIKEVKKQFKLEV